MTMQNKHHAAFLVLRDFFLETDRAFLIFPLFNPPSLPKATAFGFFFSSLIALSTSTK